MLTETIQKAMADDTVPPIQDSYRKYVTEQAIEQQVKAMAESTAATNQTPGVANWDPVLIKMVRRSVPQMIAFDFFGVQPMSGPTGSIFAMRSRYTNQTGAEAFFDEANTAFSGAGTHAGDPSGITTGFVDNTVGSEVPGANSSTGTGMALTAAENLGVAGGTAWSEMAVSVERVDVSAKSRKLKASFSHELAQDMRAIHGLDINTELSNILATEVMAEIDREAVRTLNISAQFGAQNTTKPGLYDVDTDADGRWLVEKFKGLLYLIEQEANAIAVSTRRGRGNRILCSPGVATALNMAGYLDTGGNTQLASNLLVDPSSSAYAGLLAGKYQVFIDPYAVVDYFTVAYKGANAWDAGIYYAPYVPLQLHTAVAEDTFQPKIGFSTRYGIVANPFVSNKADGTQVAGKGLGQGENFYARKVIVKLP